jgi:hypothetical protein
LGLHTNPVLLNIALPVGISFYTFHGMSYVFDIYRGQQKPVKNFIDYAVFVSFFPLLVAGPIERASHLLPQVQKPRVFNPEIANRKHYVFFQEGSAEGLCGSNDLRNGSIVYLGSNCKGPLGQVKNYQSIVWVHEVFHNFGAVHTSPRPGVCELMAAQTCWGRPSKVRIQLKLKGYDGLYPVFTSGGVWKGRNLASQLKPEQTCTAILVLPFNPSNRFLVCPVGSRAVPTGRYIERNSDLHLIDLVMDEGGVSFPLSPSGEIIERNGVSEHSVSYTKHEVGVTVMRERTMTGDSFAPKTTIFWRN